MHSSVQRACEIFHPERYDDGDGHDLADRVDDRNRVRRYARNQCRPRRQHYDKRGATTLARRGMATRTPLSRGTRLLRKQWLHLIWPTMKMLPPSWVCTPNAVPTSRRPRSHLTFVCSKNGVAGRRHELESRSSSIHLHQFNAYFLVLRSSL